MNVIYNIYSERVPEAPRRSDVALQQTYDDLWAHNESSVFSVEIHVQDKD